MNAVFVDFQLKKDWLFTKELEAKTSESWETIECRTNQYHGSKMAALIRFFWYFAFPLKMVFRRTNWDRIIAWQQFYGLNFAFWCRLLHLNKLNELTIMTFIYKEKSGVIGKLYHRYMSFMVRSKYIDRFVCFSKEECDYYPSLFNVSRKRFIYVPLGIEPINYSSTKDEGYIFATGRSNRDYDFLLSVLDNSDYQCQIACDTMAKTLNEGEGISILTDCHGNEMIKRMAHSHCVVIPLKDIHVSSGQLVILQAMALGKPVICTDADGIRDYASVETAMIIPNELDKWRNALSLLYNDKNLYDSISMAARVFFKENFTANAMFSRIAHIIYNGDCLHDKQ